MEKDNVNIYDNIKNGISHMQNLKMIQINLFIKQKQTQIQKTNLWLLKEIRMLGLTCTLLYTKQ